MRIGIDGRLGFKEGIGRYLFELVNRISALAPEYHYILYFNAQHADYYTQHAPRRQNIEWRMIDGAPFKLREQINLVKRIRGDQLDLYHATFEYAAPIGINVPVILTVHDAYFLPPAKSLGYFRSFSTYLYYQVMIYYGLITARRVITVSNFVRQKIVNQSALFRSRQAKIEFIHNGVGEEFSTAPHDAYLPLTEKGIDRYILYVGALTNHKNIFGLLAGYGWLARHMPDCPPLVVAGKPNKNLHDLTALIDEQGIAEKVVFLGFVPNESLPGLFANAEVFAFPSLHEGFGIPILEAMACGAPVLTSNTSALPEVAADAATLVDPSSPQAIGEGLLQMCRNPELRQQLRDLGRARAATFSWDKTARATLQVYREVLESR